MTECKAKYSVGDIVWFPQSSIQSGCIPSYMTFPLKVQIVGVEVYHKESALNYYRKPADSPYTSLSRLETHINYSIVFFNPRIKWGSQLSDYGYMEGVEEETLYATVEDMGRRWNYLPTEGCGTRIFYDLDKTYV